jgi:hypothetical protein
MGHVKDPGRRRWKDGPGDIAVRASGTKPRRDEAAAGHLFVDK